MKLKFTILFVLSFLSQPSFSECFTQTLETEFFSELFLGNDKWFVEVNKYSHSAYPFGWWEADSMAISCNSGSSMVKQTSFKAYLDSENQYVVFNNDSLVNPIHFDSQSDSITLLFYMNSEEDVIIRTRERRYTSPLSQTQSMVFYSFNCFDKSSYITDSPTPGKANVVTGLHRNADTNSPLTCDILKTTGVVRISIGEWYNQKSSLVALYNTNGEEVFLKFLDGQPYYDVDANSFPEGIYIAVLKNNQGTVATATISIQ